MPQILQCTRPRPTSCMARMQDVTVINTHVSTECSQTWNIHTHHRWPCDWTRNQCVTVAQLCTGHSLLLAAYLHRIGWWDSDTCPHCNGADETAEHLVLHCPAHDQARRESWPNLHYQSDPRCLWSFLEKIGEVTRPPDREQERESTTTRTRFVAIGDLFPGPIKCSTNIFQSINQFYFYFSPHADCLQVQLNKFPVDFPEKLYTNSRRFWHTFIQHWTFTWLTAGEYLWSALWI